MDNDQRVYQIDKVETCRTRYVSYWQNDGHGDTYTINPEEVVMNNDCVLFYLWHYIGLSGRDNKL